ncbi:hypothetical protein RDWZM_001094 [Blomia tropicalis]|uniref:AP5B1 middle domain-containing protein n=1 Tax=Blomia tropicalis TaxID=40697 RepID=A0A9Q0RQ81_BLOTA|nr:hypothetical protein RDWZM_001094 [Blomia tropicalis]
MLKSNNSNKNNNKNGKWKGFRRSISSKSKNILIPSDPNWIDRYFEISRHLCFGDYERSWFDDVHLDVLRDLCNEDLPVDYVFHLLTLLELIVPLLDTDDKIEQTIGSLLNIATSHNVHGNRNRPPLIMEKCIYSTTTLVLYTKEWVTNSKLEILQKFLMKQSQKPKSILYNPCSESLAEITRQYPNLISDLISENFKISLTATPKNLFGTIYLLSLYDSQNYINGVREITQQIRYVPNLQFYHLCTQIYHMIESKRYTDSLSLIILKPFLNRFISSNSIHNVHFALKLLIKFGFEIFSSTEEEFFIKQLVILSTLPSLPIGYRLLALSFIKIAFVSIYKPPLNSPPLGLIDSLCPFLFDGPDTQEKKLTILNEFSFVISDNEFFNLIIRLHRLSNSQNNNFKRCTRSLFRTLSMTLKKRLQLMDRILNLLLDGIFSPSYIHYVDQLYSFLSQHWSFAQLFVDKFVAKLMILLKDQPDSSETNNKMVPNYNHYFAYLQFINWFISIAHHHIELTEFQIEFIINFIRINCQQWTQSSMIALTCCTSILYYQSVTAKVKEALLTILEWLKTERKMDIETSSLAQIYLLALRTLKEEYIRQVFTSDEEEFLIQKVPESFDDYLCSIVQYKHDKCPLIVRRLSTEDISNSTKQQFNEPLSLTIPFEIMIEADSEMDRLFCLEVSFSSNQIESLKQSFKLPLIEKQSKQSKINLKLDFIVNIPFWLNISVKFSDYKGTIFNYYQPEFEYVALKDVFIQVEVDQFQSNIESITESILQHPDAMQTVICVRNHSTFESFFAEYDWMKKFVIHASNHKDFFYFVIGLAPNRLIIGTIKIINDFINLYLTTNNFEIVPSLLVDTFTNK